jgi:hypothetical protein
MFSTLERFLVVIFCRLLIGDGWHWWDTIMSYLVQCTGFTLRSPPLKEAKIKVCSAVRGSISGKRIRVHRIVFLFFNKCMRIGIPDSEYVSVPIFPLGFCFSYFWCWLVVRVGVVATIENKGECVRVGKVRRNIKANFWVASCLLFHKASVEGWIRTFTSENRERR